MRLYFCTVAIILLLMLAVLIFCRLWWLRTGNDQDKDRRRLPFVTLFTIISLLSLLFITVNSVRFIIACKAFPACRQFLVYAYLDEDDQKYDQFPAVRKAKLGYRAKQSDRRYYDRLRVDINEKKVVTVEDVFTALTTCDPECLYQVEVTYVKSTKVLEIVGPVVKTKLGQDKLTAIGDYVFINGELSEYNSDWIDIQVAIDKSNNSDDQNFDTYKIIKILNESDQENYGLEN